MEVTIRKEVLADFPLVYKINKEAFESTAESELVDALRKSDAFIPELSLVALVEGEITGHILFTKIEIISTDGETYKSLALAPMAVSPNWQKQGIGSRLVEYGIEKAKSLGFDSIIVLGYPKYYPKFGFGLASKFNIKAPFEVPDSAFMAIGLAKDSLKGVEGIVKYSKEFDGV